MNWFFKSIEGAARRAPDNAHPVSCVVPSLRSGQRPECASQDEDREAARETGALSEHGLLLHEPGRREGGQEPINRHGGREHRREVCQGRGEEGDWR